MNARYTVLLVMLAVFASQKAMAQDTSVSIPLPSGAFSIADTGSPAICLNPTTFAEQACTAKGVLVIR
jgi:hypothetical protein